MIQENCFKMERLLRHVSCMCVAVEEGYDFGAAPSKMENKEFGTFIIPKFTP